MSNVVCRFYYFTVFFLLCSRPGTIRFFRYFFFLLSHFSLSSHYSYWPNIRRRTAKPSESIRRRYSSVDLKILTDFSDAKVEL